MSVSDVVALLLREAISRRVRKKQRRSPLTAFTHPQSFWAAVDAGEVCQVCYLVVPWHYGECDECGESMPACEGCMKEEPTLLCATCDEAY